MKIIVRPAAAKYLERLDDVTNRRIKKALWGLAEDPPRGDIKKLAGEPTYRLRVGGFRVLYNIEDGAIVVGKIAPRGDVYKGGR